MNRRRFLTNGAAAAYMAGRGRSQQPDRLERVAVMTSYFGRRMPDIRDRGAPKVKKDLNLLDFPEMIADRLVSQREQGASLASGPFAVFGFRGANCIPVHDGGGRIARVPTFLPALRIHVFATAKQTTKQCQFPLGR